MRPLAAVLAAALFAAVGAAEAQSYKPEFKSRPGRRPHRPVGGGHAFAELLEERTQGRINVKNYFAGQLFAGKQTNGLGAWPR